MGVRRSPRQRSSSHLGGGSVLAGREQKRTGVWCQYVSGCGDPKWDWEVWDRVPVLTESNLLGR